MFRILGVFCILIPLGAALIERSGNVLIAERHHRHHDTYAVSPQLLNALVKTLFVMGAIGVLVGLLTQRTDYWCEQAFVLAFFDAFVITVFLAWLMLSRHKVSLFEDHMVVTPVIGRDITVWYANIDRLSWCGLRYASGYRSLRVSVDGRRATTVYGVIDVEQVLLHVDRFDVLELANDAVIS